MNSKKTIGEYFKTFESVLYLREANLSEVGNLVCLDKLKNTVDSFDSFCVKCSNFLSGMGFDLVSISGIVDDMYKIQEIKDL